MDDQSFALKRKHLEKFSDEELHDYFWELSNKIVDPIIELAQRHTSPSIERSVLLRMGFSSEESQKIVNKCIANNLLRKGAGNVVYRYAKANNLGIRNAGLRLIKDTVWSSVKILFQS